jgi:hypothetical protein
MAYNVAQAEVTVTPDARGFGNELRAQIAAEADRSAARSATHRERPCASGCWPGRPAGRQRGRGHHRRRAKVDEFLAKTKAKAAAGRRRRRQGLGKNMADGPEGDRPARSADRLGHRLPASWPAAR